MKPEKAVSQWNTSHPIGTPVEFFSYLPDVWNHDATGLKSRTRTNAEVLSGHTAVVWIEGKAGCVALESLRVCPANAVPKPLSGEPVKTHE